MNTSFNLSHFEISNFSRFEEIQKSELYQKFEILFIYIDTNNSGLKVPGPYQAELLGQTSLPSSPRQETF